MKIKRLGFPFAALLVVGGIDFSGSWMLQAGAQEPDRAELEYVHSFLNSGFSDWNDLNFRNIDQPSEKDVLILEADYKNHFSEPAALFSANLTRNYSENWYQDYSGTYATNAKVLPGWILFTEIHRKWTAQKSWVTGFGVGYISNEAPYSNAYGLAEISYYFPQLFSLQGGFRLNDSFPGAVVTCRAYAVLNLVFENRIEAFLKFEMGHEGYSLVAAGDFKTEFSSVEETAQVRYWFRSHWGGSLNIDFYQSPYYDRNSLGVAALFQF